MPGRYLTQQRSDAEKVGQLGEDDDQFEWHFSSVQTKREIYSLSLFSSLDTWRPKACFLL